MFSALQNRQFCWLLASNFLFFLAMHGQMLTRSVLAWNMTGDEMALASINAAYALPMILFALIGGALTDRFERRSLTQYGQWVLTINECTIWLLLLTDQLAFWHLIAAGVIGGIVNPMVMAARTSLVFNTVGAARLGNATALSASIVNVTRVVGPMIMGALVASVSVSAAYLCAVICFALCLFCLFGVDKKPPAPKTQDNSTALLADVKAGLIYVKNSRPILACLVFGFLPASLSIPVQNMLILFTDTVWNVGESGLGMLMAVAGVGGIAGSFWVAKRGENNRRVKPMIVTAVAFTIFQLFFSASPNIYLAIVPFIIANACASACMTLNNTALQLIVDDEQRGRVSSVMMMTYGFTPLGVLPLAWMAKQFGVNWVVSLASFGLCLVILFFYKRSNSLRLLDNTVAQTLHKTNSKY